jgi:acyl carrier protein
MYGITETTVHVSFRPLSRSDLGALPRSPIGVAIPDLRLYLLDRHGIPVPLGAPGEIHVGGAGLARGYLARPGLSAARFVPDPFSGQPGERLYRTGDLARQRPDGSLEFAGRIDHQVKIRGFRIELGEIESVLGTHPDVQRAVVLAREEVGETQLAGYVEGRAGTRPVLEELRSFLRQRLPDYMVPASFVALESLPVDQNGKIDRRALAALRGEALPRSVPFVPPSTEAEESIAQVWCEVLGLEAVGVNDTFFDLGGHSLALLQVQRKLQDRLGREIPIIDLFGAPTVAALALRLAGTGEEGIAAAAAGDERAEVRREARRRRDRRRGGGTAAEDLALELEDVE